MMHNRQRQSRGFTLIELILALLMTAMLALTLYTCLSIAYKAKRTAEAAVYPTRQAQIAMDIVCKDLMSATQPPLSTDTSGDLKLTGDFEGTQNSGSDMVDFYGLGAESRSDTSPFSEGIRHIVLFLKDDSGSQSLVRDVTRNLLAPNTPDPDEDVLCHNVSAFTIKYYDGTDWTEAWDSTSEEDLLPLQAQVDLTVSITNAAHPNDKPTDYHLSRTVVLPLAHSST